MAGEARAYLMRGRPVRLQSTSQTSIRNSSGRRLPAAEIRPGSLVAQSSALLRASKAVIAALVSESRRVLQAGLERALLARVRVHVRGRRSVVVVASGLRGFVQSSGTLWSGTGTPPRAPCRLAQHRGCASRLAPGLGINKSLIEEHERLVRLFSPLTMGELRKRLARLSPDTARSVQPKPPQVLPA